MAVGRVVIVGAGPAGAALAYLLARRGVEVALPSHVNMAASWSPGSGRAGREQGTS